MDYLFLFLVSTGFAKSFFRSLKSSVKSLISFVVTIIIFSFVFLPLKNLVLQIGLFKQEFLDLVKGGFLGQQNFTLEHQNKALLIEAISTFGFPQLIKNILLFFASKGNVLSIGGVIGEALYQTLAIALVGVFLFVLISVFVHIFLSFVFFKIKGGENLFVTKRLLSGCVGGVKGVLIFLTIETALLSFAEVLSISFLKNFVLSSSVGSIGNEFLSGAIFSLSQGLF